MSDETKDEAAELVKRAGTQAKNSVKNTRRAAKVMAEPVVDSVAEELHDTAEKLEDTAEDAIDAARRISPRVLSAMSSEVGMGFLALSISLTAGTYAANKFRMVYANRSQVLK